MTYLLKTTAYAALLAGVSGLAIPAALADSRVGVSSAVNKQSTLERGAIQRTFTVGEDVNFKDRIITNPEGLAQVLFVDGSTFTIGSNTRVVIDEFVYNPADGSGALVSEVTKGALRFVGGKLSKGTQPVKFKTPVGILGVRGGIMELDLNPSCESGGGCPVMTASLIFGDELTLDADGGGSRQVFDAGQSIVVRRENDGFEISVVPTETLGTQGLQQRLTGSPRQNGGAPRAPAPQDVVDSGLPQINSNQSPFVIRPVLRPEVVTTAVSPEPDSPGISGPAREVTQSVNEKAQGDVVREETDPVDPTVRQNLTGLFATPQTAYQTSNGAATVADPFSANLAGPVPAGLISVNLLETPGGVPTGVEIGDISLPFPTSPGTTPIDPVYSTTYSRQVEGGTILGGPGGFALYFLSLGAPDSTTVSPAAANPSTGLYVVVGNPTPREVFYPDVLSSRPAQVRTYSLGEDYVRTALDLTSAVPLLNTAVLERFGNRFVNDAVETPLYVIERTNLDRSARTLYAAFGIEGYGPDQRSFIVSDAGLVFGSLAGSGESALGVGGTRRGSYRFASSDSSTFMRGGTGSTKIENPLRFTAIAGPDGEAFIYSSGIHGSGLARNSYGGEREFIDVNLSDPLNAPTDGTQYGSALVPALLSDKTALSTLNRPSVIFNGFASGMVENADLRVVPYRSYGSSDVLFSFDGSRASLGGVLNVSDVNGADPDAARFQYAFGFDVTGTFPGASSSRSAYLDLSRFAANSTGPSDSQGGDSTLLFKDDGTVISHRPTTSATPKDPGTYVVSSGLVPQPELFSAADVQECACEFMKWGWWGSQTQFEDSTQPSGQRTDFVHLGTWAIGDLPRGDELPLNGTATYNGHAVGNVSVSSPGSTAQYVAVGDMQMTYDFAERAGSLEINNFDGRDMSGTMFGSMGVNGFEGSLSGLGLEGSASGAFARGPASVAQGVLGSFDVTGPGYNAVGSFLGETR